MIRRASAGWAAFRGGLLACTGLLLIPLPALGDRVHVVQPGESLWQIAAMATGDPTLWPLLYRANRDQIKDPSVLYPGQKLTIPDLTASPPGTPPPVAAPPPSP